MPVLPIVRLGHPSLRTPAVRIEPRQLASPDVQQLIDDMIETMRDAPGVGLAAPQVAHGLQLFVYEVAGHGGDAKEYPQPAVPLHVVVNPMITPQSRELIYDWEGCLSIPDLRGLVPRHPAVRVRGLDRAGRPLDYVAAGLEARIIQHEFDHLNGVIFLDRMRDLRALAYYEEWERYMQVEDPENAPVEPRGEPVTTLAGGDPDPLG